MKLSVEIYRDPNPVRLARFFLGKVLMVRGPEGVTGGVITETEAYGGAKDKASHAYNNRRTARTEIMFAPGGRAYVYLCYGIHELFNIITGEQDVAQAVLVRAVLITDGEEFAASRRQGISRHLWANGPGRVSAALGINRSHNGADLTGDSIWIEDRGIKVPPREIQRTPRIGVNYAGAWALKPWRFLWTPHDTGPGKTSPTVPLLK